MFFIHSFAHLPSSSWSEKEHVMKMEMDIKRERFLCILCVNRHISRPTISFTSFSSCKMYVEGRLP